MWQNTHERREVDSKSIDRLPNVGSPNNSSCQVWEIETLARLTHHNKRAPPEPWQKSATDHTEDVIQTNELDEPQASNENEWEHLDRVQLVALWFFRH